ncbi:MAG: flagellum-specific ATP synthase FliI, partial [Firmicutes bacterium]|nr:flagellum-specific ATP synthase FliI [Bacillota bacterium]
MLKELPGLISESETINYIGKIENVTGMAMEASANNSRIGDMVMIYNEKQKREIPAEVVGFHDDKVQLMAYENLNGVGSGSFVRNTGKRLKIPVGEFLRGRIIDAMGRPMDNKGEFDVNSFYYVENETVNPLSRPPITDTLEFGIKAIDGLNTIGKGQRIGIFAGSGVGKSTLMGM